MRDTWLCMISMNDIDRWIYDVYEYGMNYVNARYKWIRHGLYDLQIWLAVTGFIW